MFEFAIVGFPLASLSKILSLTEIVSSGSPEYVIFFPVTVQSGQLDKSVRISKSQFVGIAFPPSHPYVLPLLSVNCNLFKLTLISNSSLPLGK